MAGIFPVFFGILHKHISPVVAVLSIDAHQPGVGEKPVGGVGGNFFVEGNIGVAIIEEAMALGQAKQAADDTLLLVPRNRAGGLTILPIHFRIGMNEAEAIFGRSDIPWNEG